MNCPLKLGASLYVPATRLDLAQIGNGERFDNLRSVIFCTEDSIAASDLDRAIDNLARVLPELRPSSTLRFVRVRSPSVLERLLRIKEIDRLDGFVFPKTTRQNFSSYAGMISDRDRFLLMPTLETAEAFDGGEMIRFRSELEASRWRDRILAVRIGGNDLLNLLGLRRGRKNTIYDTPVGVLISQLVGIFRPAGFAMTAPVFDRFDLPATLSREVRLDIGHGLIGKSAVHPSQVSLIESHYSVTQDDFEMACAVLDPAAAPVFQFHSCMCEPATHHRWAQAIIERRRLFGICDPTATIDHSLVNLSAEEE